jgi:hypothetical protein
MARDPAGVATQQVAIPAGGVQDEQSPMSSPPASSNAPTP